MIKNMTDLIEIAFEEPYIFVSKEEAKEILNFIELKYLKVDFFNKEIYIKPFDLTIHWRI